MNSALESGDSTPQGETMPEELSKQNQQPIIRLGNVGLFFWLKKGTFARRRFWALEDISLDLYRGECLGIVGRNGAGKSTLLQLLSGVMGPDRGTFVNMGVSVSLLSLQLGFIPYLSGKQNAILSGMLLGLKRKEVAEKLEDIISFAELEEFSDQRLDTYSSGMRARLGFSVAFQANPDVLLIDEVLTVGDAAFSKKSSDVMRERIRSNSTVVLVSHSPTLIREMCSRAIWIDKGRTKAEGDAEAITKAYAESQQ